MFKLAVSSLALTSVASGKMSNRFNKAAAVSRPQAEMRSNGGPCGTNTPPREKVAEHMKMFDAKKKMLKKKGMLKVAAEGEPIVIDTYFHMITSSTGEGTLSDTSVAAQMAELNLAFSDSNFEFRLVQKNVVANDAWFTGVDQGTEETDEMKDTLHVGNATTLNFYTTSLSDGLLGWATWPFDYEDEPYLDGVVNDYRTVPGSGAPGVHALYDEGDTGVHEVGHWLGLFHTFEGGCHEDEEDIGDGVSDTPQVAKANYDCVVIDSCPDDSQGNDMVNNFMDYTVDTCKDAFTPGQIDRAESFFDVFRLNADEDDEGEPCLDMTSLVTANRRSPKLWVGERTTSCEDPLRANQFRFGSLAVSSSDGDLSGKVTIDHKKGRIWRNDAFLYVVISPTADPEDEDAYFWGQLLFEESRYMKYLSEEPTGERVRPQMHTIGFKFPFGAMVDPDGTLSTIPANNHSHLFFAIDIHRHDDEEVEYITDCVTVADFELVGPEEEEEE